MFIAPSTALVPEAPSSTSYSDPFAIQRAICRWWLDAAIETAGLTTSLTDLAFNLGPTYARAELAELFGTAVPREEVLPNFDITACARTGLIPAVNVSHQIITPSCRLWNFDRPDATPDTPTFVIICPDSGSPAEQMTAPLHALLPYGNVRIMQWIDPHYVRANYAINLDSKVRAGIIAMQRNPGAHVIGDSQSTIPAAVLTAWMYQNPKLQNAAPASLTLISGPIDASLKPQASIGWMATGLISNPHYIHVGSVYPGAGRSILPGAVMKLMFKHAPGEPLSAYPPQALDGGFTTDSLRRVFREFHLARHIFVFDEQKIDLAAIRCPVMAFAGSRDKICTPPQSLAILDKKHTPNASKHMGYVVPATGHYGMISYPIMTEEVVPRMAVTLGLEPTWRVPSL